MEALNAITHWGSLLGLGLFLFLSGIGAGVFFWGASHTSKNKKADEG